MITTGNVTRAMARVVDHDQRGLNRHLASQSRLSEPPGMLLVMGLRWDSSSVA